MRKVNHGTITGTLSWFKILPLNGFNLIIAKQRLQRRRKRVYENSSNRCKNNSYLCGQFIRTWKILRSFIMASSNLNIFLFRDEWRRWKKVLQQCCCHQNWMKDGGLILWNAVAICEMSKTSWQTGKLRVKGDLENYAKDQHFLLEQWLIIIRFQREIYQDFINLARK